MVGSSTARLFTALLVALTVSLVTAAAYPHYTIIRSGILVGPIDDGGYVALTVAKNSFRLGVSYVSDKAYAPIPVSMVSATRAYPFQVVRYLDDYIGIHNNQGSVFLANNGSFIMTDEEGAIVTRSSRLFSWNPEISEQVKHTEVSPRLTSSSRRSGKMAKKTTVPQFIVPASQRTNTSRAPSSSPFTTKLKDSCLAVFPGVDAADGRRTDSAPDGIHVSDQSECCAKCNNDAQCEMWVFNPLATPQESNCWLLREVHAGYRNSYRIMGGHYRSNRRAIYVNVDISDRALLYGSGASETTANQLHARYGQAFVDNTGLGVPYTYVTDGYSLLAVSDSPHAREGVGAGDATYPVQWNADVNSGYFKRNSMWRIQVNPYDSESTTQADFYITPAKTLRDSLTTLWDLSGRQQLPPLHALGFIASRWGWKDAQYIEDTLRGFRNGSYPIDSFILDFEWYTPYNDYDIPWEGDANFNDFGYNNVTFPQPELQLKRYHNGYNVKFGGIRKPRVANARLLENLRQQKDWVLPYLRELNFSTDAVRAWYMEQNMKFIQDGVDYFWNDEGEAYYFMFDEWNSAQLPLFRDRSESKKTPGYGKRMFSINRSYTIGMQRLGGIAVWTGDIPATWEALRATPGYMLNWGLSGSSLITCDIGGFRGADASGELVARWYQLGVAMPLMRVHSIEGNVPHFPFNYPADIASAMRNAMVTRYRLIPHIYSLLSETHRYGSPLMQPLAMRFPWDENVDSLYSTTQFMLGDSIMSVPVLEQGERVRAYLPSTREFSSADYDFWYRFDTGKTFKGKSYYEARVPLDDQLLLVPAGTILTLGSPKAQHTGELNKSPLEVQVYTTRVANIAYITFYEDDGESNAYLNDTSSDPTIRRIKFTAKWTGNDQDPVTLSYFTQANPSVKQPHWFREVSLTVFTPTTERRSSGSIRLDQGEGTITA